MSAVFFGALPVCTVPCSPLASLAAPCSFDRSTSPSSKDKIVRPSSATSRLNSVPRMAPDATGVRNWISVGFSRLKRYAAPERRSSCGLSVAFAGGWISMLVSSLTRTVLNSDQRRVARLREPVRNRSPSCSFPLSSAEFHAVEPLRATSTLPSVSTSTQVGFSAASDTRGKNAAKSTMPASAVNLAESAAPYFDRRSTRIKSERLR